MPSGPTHARRFNVRDYLSRDELRELTTRSDARGLLEVAFTWGVIAATLAIVARYPSVWTVGPALVILGGRQLALAVLTHDAAHGILTRSRRLNDAVGRWLCGLPNNVSMRRYWQHHRRHHLLTGTDDDPDLALVAGYPTTPARLARRFARDLLGVSSAKRVFAVVMMGIGRMRYSASTDVEWIDTSGRSWGTAIGTGLRHLGPIALVNLVGFSITWLAGAPWLFALWWAAYMTTYSALLRVRSIAEHGCTEPGPDPLRNTRTTTPGPLARFLLAPHGVGYHLEHHMVMTVPCYNLPRMHRLLRERGALRGALVSPGYAAVLRDVTRPAAAA
ncbi:MAG: fatty acid desaturase family protein [Myxococcales bacterium]|nr:fatty acid desaturase family protein [Myxococcales bacterium]MCB9755219.1 fatty acid desaturase family protein [Myxococcales bacterium]